MYRTFLIVLLLTSCSQPEEPETRYIETKGFQLDGQSAAPLKDPSIRVDSVQYSFGQINYFLNGKIKAGDSILDYRIQFDRNPLHTNQFELLRSFHPMRYLDSTEMQCTMEFIDDRYVEICWRKGKKKILVRDTITLERSHGL